MVSAASLPAIRLVRRCSALARLLEPTAVQRLLERAARERARLSRRHAQGAITRRGGAAAGPQGQRRSGARSRCLTHRCRCTCSSRATMYRRVSRRFGASSWMARCCTRCHSQTYRRGVAPTTVPRLRSCRLSTPPCSSAAALSTSTPTARAASAKPGSPRRPLPVDTPALVFRSDPELLNSGLMVVDVRTQAWLDRFWRGMGRHLAVRQATEEASGSWGGVHPYRSAL